MGEKRGHETWKMLILEVLTSLVQGWVAAKYMQSELRHQITKIENKVSSGLV